ncbi:PepSY domain-containing protein [Microbacterium sp. NPDC055455]
MDDKNSTPETSPTTPQPVDAGREEAAQADAARTDATTATVTPTPAPAAPKRRRTRGLLIAGGAVLTAAILAGGGIAIGSAIADEADDAGDAIASAVSDDGADDATDDGSADDGSADDDASDDRASGDLSNLGTDSADDLVAMVEAASGAGEGEPVSIDLKRDGGAEVSLETENGTETEVRVDAAGETSVTSTEEADADDTAPQNVLDADAIAAIVDAALAEADGRIVEIEADDDSTSPWDVTVLTAGGEFIEIDLDAEFAVVATGADSDD